MLRLPRETALFYKSPLWLFNYIPQSDIGRRRVSGENEKRFKHCHKKTERRDFDTFAPSEHKNESHREKEDEKRRKERKSSVSWRGVSNKLIEVNVKCERKSLVTEDIFVFFGFKPTEEENRKQQRNKTLRRSGSEIGTSNKTRFAFCQGFATSLILRNTKVIERNIFNSRESS